jgi:hypothetical protein
MRSLLGTLVLLAALTAARFLANEKPVAHTSVG